MEKLSSYQKLKNKIKLLESENNDILSDFKKTLMEPNSIDAKRISYLYTTRFKIQDDFEKVAWFGVSTGNLRKGLKFNGIFKQIKK
jgi:hypothetical protein